MGNGKTLCRNRSVRRGKRTASAGFFAAILRRPPILRLLAAAFCVLLFPAAAREIVSPAQLVKPVRTLRVVMDNNYPPYVFLNEQGKLQGILVDQWRLWEQRTGVGAEIHGMDWGDAVRRMEAG